MLGSYKCCKYEGGGLGIHAPLIKWAPKLPIVFIRNDYYDQPNILYPTREEKYARGMGEGRVYESRDHYRTHLST